MANKYNFEVTSDASQAQKALEQISQLQDSIAERGETMLKSGGYTSSTGFQNLVAQMKLVNTLSGTAQGSLNKLQQQASTAGDSRELTNLQQQAQQLEKQLESTRAMFKELVSESQSGISRGAWNSAKRSYAGSTDDISHREAHENIRMRQRQVSNLGTRQRERANRAVDSGHMSYIDSQRFSRDNRDGSKMIQQQQDWIKQQRQSSQENINMYQQQRSIATQDFASGNISGSEYNNQLAKLKLQEDAETKLIKSLNSLSQATNEAAGNLSKSSASVNSANPTVDPKRGSFQDILQSRAVSFTSNVLGATTGNFTRRYSQGKNLNMRTADLAFQVGDNSGISAQSARNRAINVGAQRSTGFGMSDSLAYMQLAQGANYGSNPNVSSSYLKTIMQNARSSGFGVSNYNELMNTAISGGAATNSRQVNSIVNQAIGGAKNSNTQGLLQEQVKYLSQIVKNQTDTQKVTTSGIKTASATQTYLAKNGGSSWKGTAGGNNLNQMNSAFKSAGTGGNSTLLRSLIQSNPTKFQGQSGYLRAEIQASEGITNPNNIQDISGIVKNYSRGNVSTAALAYQKLGLVSDPKAAKSLAEMTEKGDLTSSDIKKWEKENNITGSNRKNQNAKSYNSSTDSSNFQSTAQYEKSISNEQNTIGKYVNSISIAVNKLPSGLASIVTATGLGTAQIVKAILEAKIAESIKTGTSSSYTETTATKETTAKTRENTSNKTGGTGEGASSKTTVVGGGGGGKSGGIRDRAYRATSRVTNSRLSRTVGKYGTKAGGWLRNGRTGSVLTKTGSVLEKGTKLLGGKGNALLAGATTAMDIYGAYTSTKESAEIANENKGQSRKRAQANAKRTARRKAVKTGARDASGWGGAVAGGEVGAGIGAAIPVLGETGIGEAAGGLIGGIAGYFGGTKAFDGVTKAGSRLKKEISKSSTINDNKKVKATDKEKRNLDQTAQLLAQAKAQNGFFGKASNANAITQSSSSSYSSSTTKTTTSKSGSSYSANTTINTGSKAPTANATGNVIEKPTLSWISENSEETVVPTGGSAASSGRSKALAAYAAQKTGVTSGGNSGGINIPITVNVNGNVDDANATGTTIGNKIATKLKSSLSDHTVNWSQQS